MKPFNHNPLFNTDDEGLEALQTDIMRFMAIIGFCLLAIFALVKSVQSDQQLDSDNKDQVKTLEKQLAEQAQRNRRLNQQNQDLQQQLAQRKKSMQRPVVKPPAKPQAVKSQSTPTKVSVPKKQGYALRFSDDDALLALQRSERVKVLAVRNENIYQVQTINRRLVFVLQHDKPKSYHALVESIPDAFQQVWKQQYDNLMPSWGVVLPDDIEAQIQQLMTQHTSGELSIDAQGLVQYIDS